MAAPMAEIAARCPERVVKDPHGRLYVKGDVGITCRGRSQLKADEVEGLLRARGKPYRKGMEERVLDFVGSDETIDRAGDVIRVAGWETQEFERNPVILLNHDYHSLPIGQALEVRKEKHEGKPVLRFSVLFADAETYSLADTVFRLYEGGFMRATSVGFIPLDATKLSDEERAELGLGPYGNEYTKQTLLELSCVTVPMNPNALEKAVEQEAISARQALPFVREAVTRGEPLLELLERLEAELNPVLKPDVPPSDDDDSEGFVVQSVLLSKEKFNEAEAKAWVKDHDEYEDHGVDEGEEYWRFRQRNPDEFKKLRNKEIDEGILLVGGPLKKALEETHTITVHVDTTELREMLEMLRAELGELKTLWTDVVTLKNQADQVAEPEPEPEPESKDLYQALLGMSEDIKDM